MIRTRTDATEKYSFNTGMNHAYVGVIHLPARNSS